MMKRVFFMLLISMPIAICGMTKQVSKKPASDEELLAVCGNLKTQDAHENLVRMDFPAFCLFRYIPACRIMQFKTTIYQEEDLHQLDDETKIDLKMRNYVCTEKFSMARINESNKYQQLAAFVVGTKDPAVMRWLEYKQLKAFAQRLNKKN